MDNRKRIEEKVFSFIRTHRMLKPGDRAVVGVSGGADSVCLLFVLLEWAKQCPLELTVVHVNHGIREDAGEDAAYVKGLCSQLGLPFYLREEDVAARAAREKRSEEEAGRLTRYEAFAQAAEQYGADKIAVAHNANDRAETMLFHLFRGSGLSGLCGIRPVRESDLAGRIIRPILCLERWEIEEYLKERGISWCTDSTNEGDAYTRNRIRHHILPYAQQEIAEGCISHMGQTADMLAETEDYLEQQIQELRAACVREEGEGLRIRAEAFCTQHPVIRKRLLYTLVKELSPEQKNITYAHIQAAMTLFTQEGNRVVCLPYGIRCRRQYEEVILERTLSGQEKEAALKGFSERQDEGIPSEIWLNLEEIPKEGSSIMLPGLGELHISIFLHEKWQDIPENQCTKWFDYDKMKKSLVIRKRQQGDYLTIRGKEPDTLCHKQIKDYMITEKIPRQQRDELWLLAQEKHILWVIGHRISEYYKVSGNTKRILQVQLKRECP